MSMTYDRFSDPLSRESRRPPRDFRAEQEEKAIADEAAFDEQLRGMTSADEMPMVDIDDLTGIDLLLAPEVER